MKETLDNEIDKYLIGKIITQINEFLRDSTE